MQKAERWCTQACQRNPYWVIDKEVMWFCTGCKWWYHYDCCDGKLHHQRDFRTLHDYLAMPLLKGGDLGCYGTAPIVYAAASLVSSGGTEGKTVEAILETRLDARIVDVLPEFRDKARRYINTHICCPQCTTH